MEMSTLTALISAAGSLLGTVVGILASAKVTNYRLKQLEARVQAHNNLIERTYKLEGQITEAFHDIRDLKAFHKP